VEESSPQPEDTQPPSTNVDDEIKDSNEEEENNEAEEDEYADADDAIWAQDLAAEMLLSEDECLMDAELMALHEGQRPIKLGMQIRWPELI
jgi:hypothetical protein